MRISLAHLPRNLLFVCLAIQIWLVILHFRLATHADPTVVLLGQIFDFSRELSIPTYWSAILAFSTGSSALLSYYIIRQDVGSRSQRIAWLGAGILFGIFAVDDVAAIHERVGAITSLDLMSDLNYKSYPWHIVVAPLLGGPLLLIVFGIWKSLRGIDGLRFMTLIALGCYVAAFGLDYIEGTIQMAALDLQSQPEGLEKLPAIMLLEEILEMSGTTLFLYVCVSHLTHVLKGTQISFEEN